MWSKVRSLRRGRSACAPRCATAAYWRGSARGDPGEPLGDGAERFYRVRAFVHDGRLSSTASPVVTATSAPLPAPPDGLRAWSRQPRSIPLTWNPSRDPVVAGYTVERSPTPAGPFEVVAE